MSRALAAALALVSCASTGAEQATPLPPSPPAVGPVAPAMAAHASVPALPGAEPLAALAWLAGTHRFEHGDSVYEEVWTRPGGGTMFGINRQLRGEALVMFEFLRIEARADGIVYIAHPGGRTPGTEFRLQADSDADGTFVFANPAHDFPQRLVYTQVDDEHMQARAESDDRALVFDFVRMQ